MPHFATWSLDQADVPRNSELDALNGKLRANAQVRVFDVASVVSLKATGRSGSTQYLWKPSTPALTVDGIHESQTGCYIIHGSGVVNPYVFSS